MNIFIAMKLDEKPRFYIHRTHLKSFIRYKLAPPSNGAPIQNAYNACFTHKGGPVLKPFLENNENCNLSSPWPSLSQV